MFLNVYLIVAAALGGLAVGVPLGRRERRDKTADAEDMTATGPIDGEV